METQLGGKHNFAGWRSWFGSVVKAERGGGEEEGGVEGRLDRRFEGVEGRLLCSTPTIHLQIGGVEGKLDRDELQHGG